jgi:hypothetical protein
LHGRHEIAARVDTGDRGLTVHVVHLHVTRWVERDSECLHDRNLPLRWTSEQDLEPRGWSVRELDLFERAITCLQSYEPALVEMNASALQTQRHIEGHSELGVGEDRHLPRPCAQQEPELQHLDAGCEKPEGAILDLPAVAIRTLEDRCAPKRREALDVQHVVDHPGAQQDASRFDLALSQLHLKRSTAASDLLGTDVARFDIWIVLQLLTADPPEVAGHRAVACHEVVDVLCRGVATGARIAQQHAPAGTPQGEGRGETSRAASHDQNIVRRGGFC